MNKTEIVEQVSIKTGLPKKKVEQIVNLFLENITEEVQNGNDVEIRGFGTFFRLYQEKRNVKSPIAGKTIEVPAKNKISFKASKTTEKEIKGA
ncbi:MAG TPA: HU family DNA-binding protein [Spirochaetota bacterium]|nr:HU family DNA-binding protein [Spirochaetota bacterium]HPF05388.1 HU family DNA-binding protein [Spirochaetota bacterium]HPJ42345.1 HU family DNA-binding protein [Spirochaetota bacterium]HPR36126.1 HU family DNA-binding protein [Spirochaetota bacterium]HRX47798.1 HU family DNA-binding protein [Spirochaetota bacterium]